MTKVLVVGQTPPPHGGQAIMIQTLLEGRLPGVEMFHVRMAFSHSMDEMGKVSAYKILHTFSVLGAIVYGRFRHGTDTLYYPPSGPSRVAALRDFALLLPTRWLFRRTVFHFHAGGTGELFEQLSLAEKLLFKLAYGEPACSIRTSPLSPADGEAVRSRLDVVVPYGIEDLLARSAHVRQAPREQRRPMILFAGLLCRSKGVDVLLEAARVLAADGLDFEVQAMGAWQSAEYRACVLERVEQLGLADRISFPGVLTGPAKSQAFADASVFCFPSFFEAETFGVVVLEAMCFGLPVVTTSWRGLPALVQDGVSGFVVPIKDALATADRLRLLLEDPARGRAMGEAGRNIFLAGYTREKYLEHMRQVFLTVAGEVPA